MTKIASALKHVKSQSHTFFHFVDIPGICRQLDYQWRERTLNPTVTLQLFVLQILHGNIACRAVRHLSNLTFTAAAYCEARQRLPLAVFKDIAQVFLRVSCDAVANVESWRGHRVWLIDGTGLSMPDTPQLQTAFGQPGRVAPGCGFPVMHVLWLFDAATGMIRDFAVNRWNTQDIAEAHKLHPSIEAGDILVGDRAFGSYAHLALLQKQGIFGLFRLHQRKIVSFEIGRPYHRATRKHEPTGIPTSRFIRSLGRGTGGEDQLVEYFKPETCPSWISREQYRALPRSLIVRELRYRPGNSRSQSITLITTLVDVKRYPKRALCKLYNQRWEIETNLCYLKQTMGLDVLHSKSVEGVKKELWVYVMVYNAIRMTMLQAAARQNCSVNRISFVDALQAWRYTGANALTAALTVNPYRPGRDQKRMIKRPKDRYKYMTKPREKASQPVAAAAVRC